MQMSVFVYAVRPGIEDWIEGGGKEISLYRVLYIWNFLIPNMAYESMFTFIILL